MSEERFAERLKAALDVAPADPALRSRVLSSLPMERAEAPGRFAGFAAAVALLVTASIVAGLVLFRPAPPAPASRGAANPPVALSDCRLPVVTTAGDGFLDLKSTAYIPASATATAAVATYGGTGWPPVISYDRVIDRWLPVPADWIAPGGTAYAHMQEGATLHSQGSTLWLKDLRDGTDRVLVNGKPIRLLGWVGDKIYYASGSGYYWGLWEFDPATATDRELDKPSPREWWFVGPDAIWGSPAYGFGVSRYDVATGLVTRWSVANPIDIAGVASDAHPLVLRWIGPPPSPTDSPPAVMEGELVLMTGPSDATLIGGKGERFPLRALSVIRDGDRTWISAPGQRIWIYTPASGLVARSLASNKSLPEVFYVAGGCA